VLDGEVGGAFAQRRHLARNDPGAKAAPVAASVTAKRRRQSALFAEPPLVPLALSLAEAAMGWLSSVSLHRSGSELRVTTPAAPQAPRT
jgi:hypothetical protein